MSPRDLPPKRRGLSGRFGPAVHAGVALILAMGSLLTITTVANAAKSDPPSPLPLGTLTRTSGSDPTCPAGFACQAFTISCPAVTQRAEGFIAIDSPSSPHGVVALFSGDGGTHYWGSGGTMALGFFSGLLKAGLRLVQVRWTTPWLAAPAAQGVDPSDLACRPATVVEWIHDNIYLPLHAHPTLGVCGFCLSGNSGGASQVTYPLAFFGLSDKVNAVVPTSGPPHAAIAKGCLLVPGYAYDPQSAQTIDSSYGFVGMLVNTGPCVHHLSTSTARWQRDSIDLGGNDFTYPTTRVAFIVGGLDRTPAPAHAHDLFDKLIQAGSPIVSWQLVPTMQHTITGSADGLAALSSDLLASS